MANENENLAARKLIEEVAKIIADLPDPKISKFDVELGKYSTSRSVRIEFADGGHLYLSMFYPFKEGA